MWQARIAPLAAALLLAGCGDPYTPGLLEEGDWGGEHISMRVSADSAAVDFDCAHGTLYLPAEVEEDGCFTASGTHTGETGAVFEGYDPPTVPARFEGRLQGDRLVLTVTLLKDGQVLGPFSLARGSVGRVYKCL
jgi:hypothetical protein